MKPRVRLKGPAPIETRRRSDADDGERLRRRLGRERQARLEAEAIAERTIRRLHASEQELREHRDHLEEQVAERTAELRVANDELEAFCYSVSHDLRAPLRGMDGFSQALLEDCADRLEGEPLDYLHRIRAASQRMAQLIDDLLTLSRVSRSEMHQRSVDVSSLAEGVAAELREREPGRRVTFLIQPDVHARADERLLHVVLENLLGNAWKFTSRHERATIECGMERNGTPPHYFVRDDGAGFDMAYADQLFGAFQRLHSTTEFDGTGIGLATVQRIVHRHGGRVWAHGEVERGASFHFTLAPDGESP